MGNKIKKILIGIVLLLLAVFSALTAFYFVKVKPSMANQKNGVTTSISFSRQTTKSPQLSRTASISKKSDQAGETSRMKIEPPPPKTITMGSLVKASEKVYGKQESLNKEGYLWIDRKNSQYVVTLGALNGLLPGKQLSVYDGDKQVGRVTVDASFDVISYVHPSGDSRDALSGDYYRVVME